MANMTLGKVANCCAKARARQLYNSQKAVDQIYQPHLQSEEFPDACAKFNRFCCIPREENESLRVLNCTIAGPTASFQ